MPGGAIVFLMFLGVAAVVVFALVKRTRRRAEAWSLAATVLGLRYVPGGLPVQLGNIHGDCKGVWVTVGLHNERSGRSNTVYTRYVVQFPRNLPLEIRLTRQGFLQEMASFFGIQDIEVGDEEFDALVVIKGDDPGAVRSFLTLGRRLAISRLYARFERVSIDRKQIEALALGADADADAMAAHVEALVRVALLLSPEVERPRPVPEAAPISPKPEAKADEPVETHVEPPPADPVEPPPPPPSLDSARDTDPGPFRPRPAEVPEPPAAPVTLATAGAGVGLAVDRLCDELFAGDPSSFEVDQRFAAHVGGLVSWTGVIRDAQAFDLDFELGAGSGVRAEIEVHEVASELGITSTITAVVRFPESALDGLKTGVGKRVSFSGALKSVKGLMKEIYVTGGRLEQ
jgi:hypothetical protein